MKTLDEIVAAARLNEELDPREARFALVAFDVLIADMRLETDMPKLQAWMQAAVTPPDQYIGEANSPENPEAVEWMRTMREASEKAAEDPSLPKMWDEFDTSTGETEVASE